MEELKRAYEEFQVKMKEIENTHETNIDDFINLDDEIKKDFMGDWTDKDVESYEYFLHRASICHKAMEIIEEERIAWDLDKQ